MFEAKFERASTLKRIIDAIAFLSEVNFDCTSAGIQLQALDPAHVSLVSLIIQHDGFEHYRCDRALTLGVSIESVSKILKCAGNEDSLTLKANDSGDRLIFIFEHKNRVSEFQLTLMEIDLEKLSIPDSSYTAEVTMPSVEFQKIISSMTTLGDAVTIAVSDGGVAFSVSGDCDGSINIKENAELDGESTTIKMTQPITLTFAMRYLGYFTKATGLSGSVHLGLSPDVPLVVEYSIEDTFGGGSFFKADPEASSTKVKSEGKESKAEKKLDTKLQKNGGKRSRGSIRYFLAPKIDEQ